MDGGTCDVIPVRARLVVGEQYQAVIQAAGAEMMYDVVDQGSQTDPTIADGSKRNEERFTAQSSLGNVVIDHLRSQESRTVTVTLENQQLFLRPQPEFRERRPVARNAKAAKSIG